MLLTRVRPKKNASVFEILKDLYRKQLFSIENGHYRYIFTKIIQIDNFQITEILYPTLVIR